MAKKTTKELEKEIKEMIEIRDKAQTEASYRYKQYLDIDSEYKITKRDNNKLNEKIEDLEKSKEKWIKLTTKWTYVCLRSEFEDYEIEDLLDEWYYNFCYSYGAGDYEWDWLIIIYDISKESKRFWLAYLDHCSCFWPLDNLSIAWFTKGQIKKIIKEKRDKKDFFRGVSEEGAEKIYKWFIDFINKF